MKYIVLPDSYNKNGSIKKLLKKVIPKKIIYYYNIFHCIRPLHKRICPICNYNGYFKCSGRPPRIDALCPRCDSLERHRLFWIWFINKKDKIKEPIIHFAPEKILEDKLRSIYSNYITADLYNDADIKIDIENINLSDKSYNTIICNQVLEHVDDNKAIKELYRILSDDGVFIVSVPIIDGWEKTYENEYIKDPLSRELHFGQSDHLRYYGNDFSEKLKMFGFKNIINIVAEGEDVIKYGLLRGEKIFICRK